MSWQATAWAERQKTGSPARKVLLLVLANYADENGVCWPSQKTLAEGTEQSLDTVQRQLRRLAADGHITVQERPRRGGHWPSRAYRLNMTSAEATEPQIAARRSSVPDKPGPLRPGRAATSTATEPQALRHKPSLEPPIEPSARPLPAEPGATLQAAKGKNARSDRQFDRGRIELELANRLGASGWDVLGALPSAELDELCNQQRNGALTDDDLAAVTNRLGRPWIPQSENSGVVVRPD